MEIKIKASELRIGNYYNHNGEIRQVTPNTILEVWESEREWCKPIPLTEEWLLKFGFEIQGKRISKDWFFLWYDNDKIVFALAEMKEAVGAYLIIKYVHQLQNLYFVLTNEELTWK